MNAPLTHALDARYYTDPAIFGNEMQGCGQNALQFYEHVMGQRLSTPDRAD